MRYLKIKRISWTTPRKFYRKLIEECSSDSYCNVIIGSGNGLVASGKNPTAVKIGISVFYVFICHFNTSRPKQNGRHFADDILKFISLNGNV